jgi:DNA ligase (NAD+)
MSKSQNLDKVLFGLGIKNCGAKACLSIAKEFKNIDRIISATYEELTNIADIGHIIANSILEYFRNPKKLQLIEKLKELGLNMEYKERNIIDGKFAHKVVVLTGTLSQMTREEAKKIIESEGGSVGASVTKKTDLLIAGQSAGSKLSKAESLGIKIINEEEFLNLIK